MSFLDKVFGRGAEQAKRDFDLELPGGPWQEAHEPSHYSYNTEGCREQVTISVSRSKQPLDTLQLMIGVLELVAARQRVLQAVSEGSARFQEVQTKTAPGRVDAVLDGVDPRGQVQFRILVQGRPDRTVTATYFNYVPFLASDAFTERADEVLAGVIVT